MTNGKAAKLWLVNVISFILFLVLTVTGLLNWLVLPRGYQAKGSILISFRHFLREVHEWTALFFIIIILFHLVLHWGYIKINFKKYFLQNKIKS
jgi:quinol-cytochrome oxidoreductase complex cytochrome b subunit